MPPKSRADYDFERRVRVAYDSLPVKIRELPDFPPIEIIQESTDAPPGRMILGRFIGVPRSRKSQFAMPTAPNMIHIYQGPVTRYARGQIDAVLKTVVWHEVAHWLGFETEEEVAELGLQLE